MRALHTGCSERPCSPAVATQLAESRRKPTNRAFQYPLKLWPDDPAKPSTGCWFEVIEGELHYLPPPCERPRLARHFLHVHATFPHEADTPSVAQLRNLPGIVALARDVPLEHATAQVESALVVMQPCCFPCHTTTQEHDFSCPQLDWYTLLTGGSDGACWGANNNK